MRLSLTPEALTRYVADQIPRFFPDRTVTTAHLYRFVDRALERTEYAFSRIHRKYYYEDGSTVFNHLNTDQYASFLYFVGNTIFRENGELDLAEKISLLNKTLHGFDVYHEVEMPDVFLLVHPVGAVLGRANYGNYLCVYQGCSAGANLNNVYPTLGEGVVLYGGARVVGDTWIGDNCWIAPNAVVMDTAVPSGSVAFGLPPNTSTKPARHNVVERIFCVPGKNLG